MSNKVYYNSYNKNNANAISCGMSCDNKEGPGIT
ncbi:hypothetical protein EVB32_360 [Rhizobium phage RHph_TM39]|uniref:Uncharacterized protein n=1 Tax=Rhizobium phage RHph_Y65 TaxID=2509785 RepID=A0A7S5R8E7_9CAUD|nr:hypothetical protein PQC17_gp277 [Rhizobium phage RHph_Y65]QIG72922.1 hypothetical protein EVB97_384 [Rhizobium phage RHph_Y65]QIG77328.1 hypothetical protein EVB32_360 [Rhizobium phage RHph_TM39]